MKRRQIIAGFGTVAAGTSIAVGSGAFGSVEATRQVSVAVENDRDAYLSLKATDSQFSSMTNESTLQFVFDDDAVAPNSVYEFTGLFEATNQGPDDIVVFGQSTQENGITTDIVTQGQDQPLTSQNPSAEITTGSTQTFGLQLTIGDISAQQTIETTVSITAATEDSERFPGVL